MALKEELNRLKAEEPLTLKKGDIKIPLSEVPLGSQIKVGILVDGKWQNTYLPLTEKLISLLNKSKTEGEIFSLELK